MPILGRLAALLVAVLFVAAGCASTPQSGPTQYDVPASSPASATFDAWFAGEAEALDADAPVEPAAGIEETFARAEIAYWEGDVERAGELYLRMLSGQPAHPLNRFAAARIYALRSSMVDFHERVGPVLEQIRLGEVGPMTRVYLGLVGQQIAWHDWRRSEVEAPFSGDALGFPTGWMTTPMLSPWRLRDFERDFEVEQHASIQDEYRSPHIAEDVPENYERSRPYMATSLRLSPGFDRSGVYYLETFVTVDPGEDPSAERPFWLYTSFSGAAKVWIDGEPVIERLEGDYATGKRLRRVALSPGEHRVLVKLGYQRNYRDWFDMALLADGATAVGDSGLSFRSQPAAEAEAGTIEFVSEQMVPSQLEPVWVEPDEAEAATDTALFLTANAAYMANDPAVFEAAFEELMARHESFAAGYILRAKQVKTLWEIPSDLRTSRSQADVRRAHKLAPHNLEAAVRLIRNLRTQGKSDRELRALLDTTRDAAITDDGRLRSIEPLVERADWLDNQGWSGAAERAWQQILEVAPTSCRAARELQSLYYRRGHYPPLEEISAHHDACPRLEEALANERAEMQELRLAVEKKRAARYPYSSSAQADYADELIAWGQDGQAMDVLRSARERMPWSLSIWNRLANLALAREGADAAASLLEEAIAENGNSGWLQWRLAAIKNDIPLREVMRDGVEAALQEVRRTSNNEETLGFRSDEAYYVIDFAAQKYFPDGSSMTLTHTLVRVMTKGAIDRFGEFSAPSGSRLVLAQTIKQDGTTRAPERMAGKSTLSMPGLAAGDFVEFAYLSYDSPEAISKTRREGTRFFFQMNDISSLHSEFLVLGTDGEFVRVNDAPAAEQVDTPLGPGVRFVRTKSPKPRQEPSATSGFEFLPWIQLHRRGTSVDDFEVSRRSVHDQIRDSLKSSPQLADQIDAWRADLEPGSRQEIEGLFYRVSEWFNDPSNSSFRRAAGHALLERDGNSALVLKAAYDRAGIPAELYLVKSRYQDPADYPVGEFSKYRSSLLKVELPGGDHVWLAPSGPDAMFGSVGLSLLGQPAVCVSCEDPRSERVPEDGHRDPSRQVDVTAKLAADGTLSGTMTLSYDGIRGFVVRSTLRQRTDQTSRAKYVDGLVSSQIGGASMVDFDIGNEDDPDKPLIIEARFARANFARQVAPGVLQVETALFREPIASSYADLSSRTTPLMVRHQRQYDYSFEVALPDGFEPTLRSQEGSWRLDSDWGRFGRSAELAENTLSVTSSIHMPIQRVSVADYPAFQQWAVGVERSSMLFLTLRAP